MICQGDCVLFATDEDSLHGIATSSRQVDGVLLIAVYTSPGSANWGSYAGWSGTEFFLPEQLSVKPDHSGRPRGKVLCR